MSETKLAATGPAMAATLPSPRPSGKNGAIGTLAVPRPKDAALVGDPNAGPVPQEWQRPERIATDFSPQRRRYAVSVEEYVRFHEQGFLIVRGLLTSDEVEELREHGYDLMYG